MSENITEGGFIIVTEKTMGYSCYNYPCCIDYIENELALGKSYAIYYYELGDYTVEEEALVDYETAYTLHARRATVLIMIEKQKDQSSRITAILTQSFW